MSPNSRKLLHKYRLNENSQNLEISYIENRENERKIIDKKNERIKYQFWNNRQLGF